ncbi:dephospho-CoA kinase [uncultured Roseobacter sp.]|uniref:dephospho-CoA kinase n=1 Tax=uncultured Roseobacter sp. TaxID=114847 RepID=UPI00263870AE|nr:dephospho-CoA kinase [uncultured Roseobacter sp.]
MMFRLGLTGSIGMGKSTTAQMFVDEGCALWDADAAVHRLYSKGGAAVAPLGAVYPDAVRGDAICRDALRHIVSSETGALKTVEGIVHPLVVEDRRAFLAKTTADIVVLDIPLLFETGGETDMDAVACVFVSPEIQEKRVLERGTMTQAQFQNIRENQMPNDEKCARADFVIVTDTIEHTLAQVQDILRMIRERMCDA